MSQDYAMSRVRDALEKCGGNQLKAQRMLMGWIENDHSLLLGLAGQHLHGIISYAMIKSSRPIAKTSMPKMIQTKNEDVPPPGKASQKHIDAIHRLAKSSKSKSKKD